MHAQGVYVRLHTVDHHAKYTVHSHRGILELIVRYCLFPSVVKCEVPVPED